jgi:hypothetical protein
MAPLKELLPFNQSFIMLIKQLPSESGKGPDKLFSEIYRCTRFVRLPTSGGREPTK